MSCAAAAHVTQRAINVHEVDDAFEQVELVLGLADATADDNHLPRPAVECLGHDCLDVVTPVEPEHAAFHPDPGIAETSHADGNRVGHRSGVPGPGHPVRVEPDHQDPWLGSGGVHPAEGSGAARHTSARLVASAATRVSRT